MDDIDVRFAGHLAATHMATNPGVTRQEVARMPRKAIVNAYKEAVEQGAVREGCFLAWRHGWIYGFGTKAYTLQQS